MAAGVSAAFIRARKSSRYAKPPASSADQTDIASLANLIQCLGERPLWPQIPAVVRPLSAVRKGAAGDSELLSVKTRVFEFTLKTIGDLSVNAASRSPLAAFALCLVGLEWGRTSADQASRFPQFEMLGSAILNGVSGILLDTLGELSLTIALAEADDDPSFAKAAKNVLREIHGGPQYAGLKVALRRLKKGESTGGHSRASKVTLIERLKWKLHGPSSLTDDLEFRGRLQTAVSNSVAFAKFRSNALDRIRELNFEAGAQYAKSFLTMSPTYRQLLPAFRRNDEVGDPTTYPYREIGRFSAATLRYVKFLSDMEVLFGSLNGFHIVEIGGGYGGQCRLIMSRFKPATYVMIDLPEMLRLAGRYLKTFGVDKAVTFRQPLQWFSQQSIDLVISNYAISEIRRSEQDRYLRDVIKQARRGYILYNATALSKRIERHIGEAPYELAEFAARIEGATIATAWPLLVDHDRNLGNALIHWGHGESAV
jgi:putative sugar O-methyltransferase